MSIRLWVGFRSDNVSCLWARHFNSPLLQSPQQLLWSGSDYITVSSITFSTEDLNCLLLIQSLKPETALTKGACRFEPVFDIFQLFFLLQHNVFFYIDRKNLIFDTAISTPNTVLDSFKLCHLYDFKKINK